ncbi:hypothetical protein [Streptomyces sp. AS02]|uniref:hypothetical protein n=1 Tax=Streptomyces sp. AS02 TaxID=2938946 RepID=UPI002021C39A|nr:hypothetical protein [Streptomyces sp. AS02]MCL8014956.1 hypothetical protein [Streptomyces sp. AS02]
MTSQSPLRAARVPRAAGALFSCLLVALLAATTAGATPLNAEARADAGPAPGLVVHKSAEALPTVVTSSGVPESGARESGTSKSDAKDAVEDDGFDAAAAPDQPGAASSGFVAASSRTDSGSVSTPTPTALPAPSADAEALGVSVEPASVTRAELTELKTVTISATGLEPGESYRVLVAAPNGADNDLTFVSERDADADGHASYPLRYTDPSFARAGTYTVTVRGERSQTAGTATFTVLDEPALPAAGAGTVTASPAVSTRTDVYEDGVAVEIAGFTPGEQVTLGYVRPLGDKADIDTYTADSTGTVADTIVAESTQSEVGDYTLVAYGEASGYAYGTFRVEPDPSTPAEPAENVTASIAPTEIDPIALAQTGVKITAQGFQGGEKVEFRYTSPTGRTVSFGSRPANSDGSYTSPFYDTSGQASPGTHTITLVGATSGYVAADFTVTESDVHLDPAVILSPDTVAQDQLFGTTMRIEGSGFIPKDYVRQVLIWPNGSTSMQLSGYIADADGSFTDEDFQIQDPLMPEGTYTMRFSGRIAGTFDVRLTIAAPADTEPGDFALTATPDSVSRAQLSDPGVTVTASGLQPGETVALEALEPSTARSVVARGKADDEGTYTTVVKARTATSVDEGTLTLTLHTAYSRTVTTDIEINDAKNPPAITLDTTVDRPHVSTRAFLRTGVKATVTGLTAGELITVAVVLPDGKRSVVATLPADKHGQLVHRLRPAAATPQQGTYSVQFQGDGRHYGVATFLVGRKG